MRIVVVAHIMKPFLSIYPTNGALWAFHLAGRMSCVTQLRYTLRTGASVFGLSAIALIVFPAFFLQLLGLQADLPLIWSMVMIGITLVALTGNMAVVSVSASDGGVRVASVVMLFAAAGLGMITLLIPVAYTWFTLAYAAVGFGFSLAYLVGLLRARHSG
jgi:hypothetical protein